MDNFGSDHGFWRGNRVIGLAELTGIPLENWSTGIILFVMFLLFLLFGVIIKNRKNIQHKNITKKKKRLTFKYT